MSDWPLVLRRVSSGGSDTDTRAGDIVCLNLTSWKKGVRSRPALAIEGETMHRPPWVMPNPQPHIYGAGEVKPFECAILLRADDSTLRVPRLEVQLTNGAKVLEQTFDLSSDGKRHQLDDGGEAVELSPLPAPAPTLLPALAIRWLNADGVLNGPAELLALNRTSQTFTITGSLIETSFGAKRAIPSGVLPSGIVHSLAPLDAVEWDRNLRLEGRFEWTESGFGTAFVAFDAPLRVVPFEALGMGDVHGHLLLPWFERGPEPPVTYEVVPGRSIGPVRLGMTRADVGALDLGWRISEPESLSVPFVRPGDAWGHQEPGLRVGFEAGVCNHLAAVLPMEAGFPRFELSGRPLNGIESEKLVDLLRAMGGLPEQSYGGVSARDLGVEASKWEASDSFFTAVRVFEPETALPASAGPARPQGPISATGRFPDDSPMQAEVDVTLLPAADLAVTLCAWPTTLAPREALEPALVRGLLKAASNSVQPPLVCHIRVDAIRGWKYVSEHALQVAAYNAVEKAWQARAWKLAVFPDVAPFIEEDLDDAFARITAAFESAGFHPDRSANDQLSEDLRWWLRAFFVRWSVEEKLFSHIFFVCSRLKNPELVPGFDKAVNTLSYSEGHDGFSTEIHLLGARPR